MKVAVNQVDDIESIGVSFGMVRKGLHLLATRQ